MVEKDVVEQNGAESPSEEVVAAEERYQFDFSLITAADAAQIFRHSMTGQVASELELIAPMIVAPEIDKADPGDIPFVECREIGRALRAARIQIDGKLDDIKFDVEAITATEVQNCQFWIRAGNVEAMAKLMTKHRATHHKKYSDLLALDYQTFLEVQATYLDAVLDLTKN